MTTAIRRILVADDDPDIVELLLINLQAAGYDVDTVANGEEALASIRRDRPDLLVLDVMMPRMDGFEVLGTIRSDEDLLDLPVVMLTAKASDADVWAGWQAGADYYLTKPFDVDELMRFISYLQLGSALRA